MKDFEANLHKVSAPTAEELVRIIQAKISSAPDMDELLADAAAVKEA